MCDRLHGTRRNAGNVEGAPRRRRRDRDFRCCCVYFRRLASYAQERPYQCIFLSMSWLVLQPAK